MQDINYTLRLQNLSPRETKPFILEIKIRFFFFICHLYTYTKSGYTGNHVQSFESGLNK